MSSARLVGSAVGVIAAMAVSPTLAHADDTFGELDCTIVPGSNVMGTSGIQSEFNDLPWLNDTDAGTFTFNGDAVCEGKDTASSNSGTGPDTFAGVYNLAASGTYVNQACGKTWAIGGGATLTGPGSVLNFDFGVTFRGKHGQMSIVVTGGQLSGVLGTVNQVSIGNGLGEIDATPTQTGGNCESTDVTFMFVNGRFHTSIAG